MTIFDQDAEQMDREELAQMQLERLQATLTRVYKNVTFYKKKFDELPEDLKIIIEICAKETQLWAWAWQENLNIEAGVDYAMLAKGHGDSVAAASQASRTETLLFSRVPPEF